MQILRGLRTPDSSPVALTIGNFDGMHRGHQALLNELKTHAQGRTTAVVIFEPHPREFFSPGQAPARLSSLREKLEFFKAAGIERVHVCRFDAVFAKMSADDFARALSERLHAKFVLIGDDFRFGSGRAGDFHLMRRTGERLGFEVRAVHSILHDGVRVSSTEIRNELAAGQLRRVRDYLGRTYSISGKVVHGDGVGKKLGYPTANILWKHKRPALSGVFAVEAHAAGPGILKGVASLGVRPTLKHNAAPVLEVHLFDFEEDIYGTRLQVYFLHKLRDEQKFPDVGALTRQIAQDVEDARAWFVQHG